MTAHRLMLLSLFCFCSAAYGEDDAALASLAFFPEPLPSSGELHASTSAAKKSEIERAQADSMARSSQEVLDAVLRRLQMLTDELSAGGYRSSALIDQLASLAALYQELGDHFPAIGALDWALENSRMHNGLYSLEHAPLLEQMIASRVALGDYNGAAPLEERLLELSYRNSDDPRVTLILAAAADRRMLETYRLLEQDSRAEVTFEAGTPSIPPTAGELSPAHRGEALRSLRRARRQYAEAVALGVKNGGYAVLDLLELEERMLWTFFLEISHPDLAPPFERNGWLCNSGEEVLKNNLGNVSRIRQSPIATANTLIRLADWRLLCSKNGNALDTYESAYQTLLDEGADAGTIVDMLSPEIPAALPAFLDTLSGDEEAQDYDGHIDVSFVVGRYGTARKIEILDKSAGTTGAVEKNLRKHIARHRFRPRFLNGELTRADHVAVRYYYRW